MGRSPKTPSRCISGRCGKWGRPRGSEEGQNARGKRRAPLWGWGPAAVALGLAPQRVSSRGLPGQGPQGLLVLLELSPEARVGLGHGAGSLHRLRTRGSGRTAPGITPPRAPRAPRPAPGPPPAARAPGSCRDRRGHGPPGAAEQKQAGPQRAGAHWAQAQTRAQRDRWPGRRECRAAARAALESSASRDKRGPSAGWYCSPAGGRRDGWAGYRKMEG